MNEQQKVIELGIVDYLKEKKVISCVEKENIIRFLQSHLVDKKLARQIIDFWLHELHIECPMCCNEEHIKSYKVSASLGDVSLQYTLGYFYEMGVGVTRDHKEALYWYELAALNGDIDACLKVKGGI